MEIIFDHIEARSHVDGPGQRTVLFMQGCPIHCPGCQNQHLWDPDHGKRSDTLDVAVTLANLAKKTGNVTISGGEPFMQAKALYELLSYLKFYEVRNIILYTGFTWEHLTAGMIVSWIEIWGLLDFVDVLVDGAYKRELDDNLIIYRGSRNQRPIDVQASLKARLVEGPKAKPVILNWDKPEILITEEGEAVMPSGLAAGFADLGKVKNNRMCGQTR